MSDLDPLLSATPPHGTAVVDSPVSDPTPVGGTPLPRRRLGRRLAVAAAALMLLLIAYYAVTLYQVHSTGRSDQARPVDAIVVMGDHAADLWSAGLAELVVVTGGNQPGDRFTEAGASANYLTDHGLPPSSILQVPLGHSSYASLDAVASMLHDRGLFRVLVVTDPFHSLRSRLIAQELGLVAYVSPTRTSPLHGGAAFSKELEEAAGIALGRIISFKRLLSITG